VGLDPEAEARRRLQHRPHVPIDAADEHAYIVGAVSSRLTTLREKLIKIGAKVVSTARYVVFQMAEVAIPRGLFRAILERIRRLTPQPVVFR
jgi:hypothetical protein